MNFKELVHIIDSQETASIKEARKLLVAKTGKSEEEADKWVRGDLRAAFPILRDKKAAKFILGTTRLFIEQQLNNAEVQNKMARILKEINEGHYEEYDRNLHGLSLDKLYDVFVTKFKESDEADRAASEGKSYGKSDYEITGPFRTFDDVNEAWGDNSQDWCVFHDEDAFVDYTQSGQLFYVAARYDWEKIPRQAGEDAPKDEYGNSLIAVSVNLDGSLATATPRWNHAEGGGDHTYIVNELEELLQVPFYKTFKPKQSKMIATWGEGDLVKVIQIDGYNTYHIGGEMVEEDNFLEDFDLYYSNGFKLEPTFEEPLPIYIDDKGGNYLKNDGRLLLEQWQDNYPFTMGFAAVQIAGKGYNFVDRKGKVISEQWFDEVKNFGTNGFARVKDKEKGWNFINIEGSLLSDVWFTTASDFFNGTSSVFYDGHAYFMDIKGNLYEEDGTLVRKGLIKSEQKKDSSWKKTMGLLKKIR